MPISSTELNPAQKLNANINSIDLDSSYFPRFIRRRLEEGESKEALLKQICLPRIVGVAHLPQNFIRVSDLIFDLPSGSKIGIERDLPSEIFPTISKLFGKRPFFSSLASLATSVNCEVVWLESTWSRFPTQAERKALHRLESIALIEQEIDPFSQNANNLLEEKNSLFDIIDQVSSTRFFRSKIMARNVLRQEWKSTDIIICGYNHANDISHLLSKEVSSQIGV